MNGKLKLDINMAKLRKLILVGCLSLLSIGCNKPLASKSTRGDQQVRTLSIEVKADDIVLFYKAKIEPIKETNISSPIEAVVKKLQFNYGQSVRKGQLLMVLSSEQLKKDYQEALTAFLKAKAEYHNQNIKSEGIEELWKIQALSKNQYIEEKQQITNYYLTYRQAEQKLKELAGKTHDLKLEELIGLNIDEIDKIEQALAANTGDMQIIAPNDGIALYPEKPANDTNASSRILEGTVVKTGQGLLEIGDMSGLALYINVNEININTIKSGQKVSITGVAFPGVTLHGKVKEVDIQAKNNINSGLPTFPVKIEVANITSKDLQTIHVGMSAEVKLIIEQPPSIRIPLNAVSNRDKQTFVKLLDEKNQIHEVSVVPGNTGINDIAILEGLKAGDKLVVPD